MTKTWNPSLLEQRCLEQLDHAENWRLLDREKPEEHEVLPWKPFQRILAFNLAVFVPVILILVAGFGSAMGTSLAEMLAPDNLVPGAFGGILVGSLVAIFAASLYRRSWNRRARWLRSQAQVEDED